MTCNFSLLALDQIMNNAATLPHMTGGQLAVPLVIRMATGGGRQLAAQHSHSLEGWYAHIPGLKVLVPGTVEDARFMLAAALADPNPVLLFEHIVLYNSEGELDPAVTGVDIDHAKVRRAGRDVTLVTYGNSLPKCLAAAETLAADGIDAEVIDLRVLRPLDMPTIVASVMRTRRVVIVDEGWKSGSISAEIAARLAEDALYELDAPVRRVCSREVPVPYAAHLEEAALPRVARHRQALRLRERRADVVHAVGVQLARDDPPGLGRVAPGDVLGGYDLAQRAAERHPHGIAGAGRGAQHPVGEGEGLLAGVEGRAVRGAQALGTRHSAPDVADALGPHKWRATGLVLGA